MNVRCRRTYVFNNTYKFKDNGIENRRSIIEETLNSVT